MLTPDTNDAEALALSALAATLADGRRAQRLLDLTGLTAGELRARAGERQMLASTLRFLEDHEPDLFDVADTIGVRPDSLIAARRTLEA
nr:DUF3572 family protein [uncultured Sphingomonas sp.]